MEKCESCGKRANVAYNRYFRFFPAARRTFCDSCFEGVQRKEDFTFIGILIGVFILTIGLIFLFHHMSQTKLQEHLQQQEAYYDANDLNKDGRVDFWEGQATDEMRSNLTSYGYPWEEVYGETPSGSRPRFMITRDIITEIAQRPGFFRDFNFSGLMKTHFASLTDPNSKRQLFRVFTTLENKIVFVVRLYDQVPEGGFNDAYFAPPPDPKSKKGKDKDVEEEQLPKLEPTGILIFMENLSEPKINTMMGIEQDEYHVANFKLVKGPMPKKKKK